MLNFNNFLFVEIIIISRTDDNGARRDEFRYIIIYTHPHTQIQRYQIFVSTSYPPDNGYNLVPILIPIFLLLQY